MTINMHLRRLLDSLWALSRLKYLSVSLSVALKYVCMYVCMYYDDLPYKCQNSNNTIKIIALFR